MADSFKENDRQGEVENSGHVVSKTTGEITDPWGRSTGWEMRHGQAKPKSSN
ncbi:MAG: hypothetical protein KDA16_00265 [Phycisphaerales bacterium]|nr:hypothetical protein [Phycisphaerales bacterium]